MCTAVVPAILLPHADDIPRIDRIDCDGWLNFSIRVDRARLASVQTTCVGAGTRDNGDWGDGERSGRADHTQRQDHHQCEYERRPVKLRSKRYVLLDKCFVIPDNWRP